MQGVGSDGAAFEGDRLERCEGRCDFVAAYGVARRQRQAGLGVPDADHKGRHEGAPAFIGASEAFAVHRHDALCRPEPNGRPQGILKARHDANDILRVKKAEDPAEAVVARGPMR
jgi:hypothetical protein